MSYFRIFIYLKFIDFIKSFFITSTYLLEKEVKEKFNHITNKKESVITSQLRTGLVIILKHLKKKSPSKREIIVSSYNLAEMVSICKNLKLKLVFPKLNSNFFLSDKDVKKKINKNTLAVLTTNIFNDYNDILKIKKICKIKKIPLIEDNAIYFGNYVKKGNKKIYSGSAGDYSLHSFNIMKNISAMFGGMVSTNDKTFIKFAIQEIQNYKNFSNLKYAKQIFIYILLKIFSIKFLYKLLFFHLIKISHKKNIKFIMNAIYPSLKFDKKSNYKSYLNKAHPLSISMINIQLKDNKTFNSNYKIRIFNNMLYRKLFKKYKINQLKTFKITEKTFQNFNEFPIIVEDKDRLKDYLFDKGVETKLIQYVDCNKIFSSKTQLKYITSYENKILCLPNHKNINKSYILYIVDCINSFYKNN